ncbi:MAG: DUF1854 domain-containing protein [Verrucomicrobia bacterium]|nr:DUF1854 domain-containing protein [Verrucomicrobiota bacterium]
MITGDFQLHRNAFGQLVFTGADGTVLVNVAPARAFPITANREGIALLDHDGHELAWIPQLDDLPDETRRLVDEEFAGREFMPEIQRIRAVSGYDTPCTWRVATDRGDTTFVLQVEEDIRRLSVTTLLIVDSRGIQFLIRNTQGLDATSRKIIDRFL